LELHNPAPYVALSNIYVVAGKFDDVRKVRKLMKDRGMTKKPRCSWIVVKERLHVFHTGDIDERLE
jgi:pentatricopeptide repeat protein